MPRSTLVLAGLCLLAGCNGWGGARPVSAIPTPVAATDRLQVWSHGEAHELHAVSITTDSLRGIPWWNPPECDSCRVTLARADIDSVRVRGSDGGNTGVLALLLVPVVFVAYFVMAFVGEGGGS